MAHSNRAPWKICRRSSRAKRSGKTCTNSIDSELAMFSLKNKTVLITGGTGSFGKKCTEHLLRRYSPKRLIIFSRDELKQHEMRVAGFDDPVMRYFIGDV